MSNDERLEVLLFYFFRERMKNLSYSVVAKAHSCMLCFPLAHIKVVAGSWSGFTSLPPTCYPISRYILRPIMSVLSLRKTHFISSLD